MKKLFIFLAVALFCSNVIANPVSKETAKKIAYRFVSQKKQVKEGDVTIVYSQKLTHRDHTAFYVCNVGDNAFVVVSGDDVAQPILGFSYSNTFGTNVPSNVAFFLSDLANEIDAALTQDIEPVAEVKKMWNDLLQDNASAKTDFDTVGPFLTTIWGQGQYYNNMCPYDTLSTYSNHHVPVGCEAVAMAQIIRFWEYPVNPRGRYSYYALHYGLLAIDFDTVLYNYNLMADELTGTSSAAEVNEVARLLSHCGISLQMNYDTASSGAYNTNARTSLINHYGYKSTTSIAAKAYYTSTTWINMLKAELDAGRPILYSGRDESAGGHAFVCDGYADSNYFHFNFGWTGYGDGYYLTSALNPVYSFYGINFPLGSYNSSQAAVLGIEPDTNNIDPVILSRNSGTSKFVVDRPLDFYNIRSLNAYNSGTELSKACYHYAVFTASHPGNHLIIEILDSNSTDLKIYDGESPSTLIRTLDGNNSAADLMPIVTGTSSVKFIDMSSATGATGFHVRITEDTVGVSTDSTLCALPQNLTVSVLDSSTIHLSWNGTGAAWQVEYGNSGFSQGSGTFVNVDTLGAVISGLVAGESYDFYVRTICNDSLSSDWDWVTVTLPQGGAPIYWSDVVTSQPDGYQIGADGNVYIYSSEGLAWLISVCNHLNEAEQMNWRVKKVSLMTDVDMSGYLWKPINFYKNFDGNNHVISGLTIIEDSTISVGFFSSVGSLDTVRNVIFKDCDIQNNYSLGTVGCIASMCNGTIMNCGISGSIVSAGYTAGGIVGSSYGNIVNSFSLANVIGKQSVGGAVGSCQYTQTTITNCYSAGTATCTNTNSSAKVGVFVGAGNPNNDSSYLAYWRQTGTTSTGCGNNLPGFYAFSGNGVSWNLSSPMTVEGQNVSTLVDALNAWVDGHNTNGEYKRWTIDENNENQGFPIFDTNHYYSVVLQSADTTQGTVAGGGYYLENESVTVTAQAKEGYLFSHWSNGRVDNPYSFIVTEDVTLTAYFLPENGISEPNAQIKISVENSQINIQTNCSSTIKLFDIMGRQLFCGANTEGNISITVPTTGVYILQVDNQSKKIVVPTL